VNEIYNSLLITQKNVENLGKRKYVNSQQYLLDDTIFSSKILLVTLDDVQPLWPVWIWLVNKYDKYLVKKEEKINTTHVSHDHKYT